MREQWCMSIAPAPLLVDYRADAFGHQRHVLAGATSQH
jgi:hypothetical protein